MGEGELLGELRSADVLVHLSTFDSYPLTVLEALACGTLPLVADMAGVRAMVAAYDGQVMDGPDGAAAAAWLATQDPADLRRRAAAVEQKVRADFAWTACVERLAAAIAAMRGPAATSLTAERPHGRASP